ncbi:hypothetical protein HS125_01240 [bacterium]|nr:hypothetical protein [bacterium]
MESSPRVGIVVPHTHWDRAWYNPFEEFRVVLVDRIRRLLDLLERRPEYTCFVFDGQMVPFEDYLEIHPEDRPRLERQVRAGRLIVGPWYVLPDEYLVSGESLVRNLLIGMKRADELGRCMRVGYIPDPFGHVSQLPQILAGFGIDSAIFARGLGNDSERLGIEFEWQSACPDISVMAVHQIGSYINLHAWGVPLREPLDTEKLNYDAALRRLMEITRQMEAARPATPYLLLSNGMDHYPAQPGLPELIAEMNRRQSRVRLRHGSFEDFVRAVQSEKPRLEKYRGELHDGKHHFILSGVFSSRMPLKQENFGCQNLLESVTEPLATWAWLLGRDYPSGLLDYAWRTLMKNHPHDDICGCSTDEVHEDMWPRFKHVREVGRRVADRSLADMGGEAGEGLSLYVFNPHTETRDIPVRLYPHNVRTRSAVVSDGAFVDGRGNAVPTSAVFVNERRATLRRDEEDTSVRLYDAHIHLHAPAVPGLGVVEYRYDQHAHVEVADELSYRKNSISNAYLRLSAAKDGTLSLLDKISGKSLRGFVFEDEPDMGDEYDFSPLPPERHQVTTTRYWRHDVTTYLRPHGVVELCMQGGMSLLAALGAEKWPRGLRTAECFIWTMARLYPGSRRVEFETRVLNGVRDHRLRAVFPTGINVDHTYADSAFDIVKRAIGGGHGEGWAQPSQPTHHAHSRVLVESRDFGVALFHRGTPEYEARLGKRGVELCLTLLRCVGRLSGNDLLTRSGGAGPEYSTSQSQCPGCHTFEYALELYDGPSRREEVLSHGRGYALGGYARLSILPKRPEMPPSLVQLHGKGVELSALKKCETRDSVILRFWNTSGKRTSARIRPAFRVLSAFLCNLREERGVPLAIDRRGTVRIDVRAGEIVTVELVSDLDAPFGFQRTPPKYGDVTRLP